MENTHDLRVLLASRYPLLFVATREKERFLEIVERAETSVNAPVRLWSATQGLRRSREDSQYAATDLRKALEFIGEITSPGVLVLRDAREALPTRELFDASERWAKRLVKDKPSSSPGPKPTSLRTWPMLRTPEHCALPVATISPR